MYVSTRKYSTTDFSCVYSWRTGPRQSTRGNVNPDVVPDPPVRKNGEGWITYQGRVNAYYTKVRQNVESQERYRGNFTLNSEGGHNFIQITGTTKPGRFIGTDGPAVGRAGTISAACYCYSPESNVALDASYRPSLFAEDTHWSVALPTDHVAGFNTLAKMSDDAYFSMLPTQAVGGWGETIVELLRGNFPRVIPDLMKRVARGRSLNPKASLKDLGSDYLNLRFGVEPIARDTINLIKHLQVISEGLYESTKRHRTTGLYHQQQSTVRCKALIDGGVFGTVNAPGTVDITSDFRVGAKFVKIRPSNGAFSMYNQSHDWLHKIGVNPKLLWDLTPWSWLMDWSLNIGKSIESASLLSTTGYTPSYAYATRKTNALAVPNTGFTFSSGRSRYSMFPALSTTTVTERKIISPFGPKFAVPTLTSYQWSILVALGLAKAL